MTEPTAWTHFQPYIMVSDTGIIDIDFFDCYQNSTSAETGSYIEDDLGVLEITCDIFDKALGFPEPLSTADRLRRLADYMDAHSKKLQT